MFSPEGYIRFSDVLEELSDWSSRIVLAHRLSDLGKEPSSAFRIDAHLSPSILLLEYENIFGPGGDPKENLQNIKQFARFRSNFEERSFNEFLLAHLLLSRILLDFDTLLCSPGGQLLRAPKEILLHMDRLDWCVWDWPVRERAEFFQYFKGLDAGVFEGRDIANRYCFVDGLFGVVTLKNNSLSGYERAAHCDYSDSDVRLVKSRLVEPFLGWSVVWSQENFPTSFSEVITNYQVLDESWNVEDLAEASISHGKGVPRGRKPSGTREEYFRRYPIRKPTNLSFDAIAAELTEAGFPISARMLQNYEKQRG